ncbi:hypothetical protein [Burkholderia ubonensis]|uniref:hypothetical protein n=1 Tax=Burkholderia ubonensis TaxID=101571 RepID=UPI000AED17BD|nr:hypothetical protein [Burkholderia ubonensis]
MPYGYVANTPAHQSSLTRSHLNLQGDEGSASSESPPDLSRALASPDFSLNILEALLERNGMSIRHLNQDIKAELEYLCAMDAHFRRARPLFCDELIRWTERHIREIPLESRTRDGDAGILLSIQRFAVDKLFLPDTGRGDAHDRWQLLADYFQLSGKQSEIAPLKAMYFKDADNESFAYGEEFRFAGNTSIQNWRADRESLQSLGEYAGENSSIDRHTYENHQKMKSDSRYSFSPVVMDGKLFNPDGSDIRRGFYIYVLRPDHGLAIAKDADKFGYFHHSYMNNGLPVICAGELAIKDGKIFGINNYSGHYRPSDRNLDVAIDVLHGQGVLDGQCRIMNMGSAVRGWIFEADKLDELRSSLGNHLAPPVKIGNRKFDPVNDKVIPPWQENANRFARNFNVF